MKPGEFFVGVTDFFSIVLPGAGITFIALFWAGQIEVPADHVLHGLLSLSGTPAWAAFAVVAYALGHIVASAGALLDPLYDSRRGHHGNKALRIWIDGAVLDFLNVAAPNVPLDKTVPPDSTKALIARFVDLLVWRAWRGRSDKENDAPKAERPINGYKLARATLSARAPGIYAEVQRHEADSKFFRSLVVVAAFTVVACVVQLGRDIFLVATSSAAPMRAVWGLGYLVFVFVVLQIAFVRFCELRLKATETALQGLMVVQTLPPGASAMAHGGDGE